MAAPSSSNRILDLVVSRSVLLYLKAQMSQHLHIYWFLPFFVDGRARAGWAHCIRTYAAMMLPSQRTEPEEAHLAYLLLFVLVFIRHLDAGDVQIDHLLVAAGHQKRLGHFEGPFEWAHQRFCTWVLAFDFAISVLIIHVRRSGYYKPISTIWKPINSIKWVQGNHFVGQFYMHNLSRWVFCRRSKGTSRNPHSLHTFVFSRAIMSLLGNDSNKNRFTILLILLWAIMPIKLKRKPSRDDLTRPFPAQGEENRKMGAFAKRVERNDGNR